MARREEALGYPASNTRRTDHDIPIEFSLPSSITLPPIRDMQLPRPDRTPKLAFKHDIFGLGEENRDRENSQGRRIIEKGKGKEVDSAEVAGTPHKAASLDPVSPPHSLPKTVPHPISTPQAVQEQPALQPFLTWLPDDSLQFINPKLLSDAEKANLERQRRRSEADADLPRSISPKQSGNTVDIDSIRGSQNGRNMHSAKPGVARSRPYDAQVRPPPASGRPILGRRAMTTDHDLLRQVKSNNLTLPASAPSTTTGHLQAFRAHPPPPPLPPGFQIEYRPSPFTRAPLFYPRSQPHDRHPHIPHDGAFHAAVRKVHPPPPGWEAEVEHRPSYPSVLEPTSLRARPTAPAAWAEPPRAYTRPPWDGQKRSPPHGHHLGDARARSTARHQR